jgi:MFS family permease
MKVREVICPTASRSKAVRHRDLLRLALFPVAVIASAMIVDFAEPHLRARSVGLYYLIRSLSITPAAVIGGVLWTFSPDTPFRTAGAIGIVGTVVFAVTVDERYAT